MSSNIYERVLSVDEHDTNNRVQGPTVKFAVMVQLLSRHDHDPAEVNDAIVTLVEQGDLEAGTVSVFGKSSDHEEAPLTDKPIPALQR